MRKLFIAMYHYTRDLQHSRYSRIKGLDLELFRKQLDYFLNKYYGDDGLRNQLLHPNNDIIDIKVSFDEINYIIMQLMFILKRLLKENINYEFKDIESL